MVCNSLLPCGSSSQATYIPRYPASAAVVRSQVPFDRISGLSLPFHSFLRATAPFHIENIWDFCHRLAPHSNRDGYSWPPLWLRFHQQCLGLLANFVQKPKVP